MITEKQITQIESLLEKHFPNKDSDVAYYYIGTGRKSAQFTLHRVSLMTIGMRDPDQYLYNLPNSVDDLITKLREDLSENAVVYLQDAPNNKRKKDFHIVSFGKHKDTHIDDVIKNDVKYASWMLKQADEKDLRLDYEYGYNRQRAYECSDWDALTSKLEKHVQSCREDIETRMKAIWDALRAEKAAKRDEELKSVAKITDGRQEITGFIVSTKTQETDFGTQFKMLFESTDGNRFWGSLPKSIWLGLGDMIIEQKTVFTLKATVTAKEDHFGFMSRPLVNKAELQRLDEVLRPERHTEEAIQEKKDDKRLGELFPILQSQNFRTQYTFTELINMMRELCDLHEFYNEHAESDNYISEWIKQVIKEKSEISFEAVKAEAFNMLRDATDTALIKNNIAIVELVKEAIKATK